MAGVTALLGYQLSKYCVEDSKQDADSETISPLTIQEQAHLLLERAEQRYQEELLNPKGLLIQKFLYGPKKSLEDYAHGRRAGILGDSEDTELAEVQDLTQIFRFWVTDSCLRLAAGSKEYLKKASDGKALDQPSVLIM